MELGREFRAGDFPATPRAMIDAVRIEWRRLTLGDEDALFTFRTGRELHVITARGVGGVASLRTANWTTISRVSKGCRASQRPPMRPGTRVSPR
jgi:hypothetical protein